MRGVNASRQIIANKAAQTDAISRCDRPESDCGSPLAAGVLSCWLAGLGWIAALAVAQERQPPQQTQAEPGLSKVSAAGSKSRVSKISSTFKDAGKKVDNFGREAGVAAKTTVEGAKDAAGAVARLPGTPACRGHEKCPNAPNGAPDCVTAATALCKAKGFESGKSARHDHRRRLPARRCMLLGPQQRPRLQDRNFRLARTLPIARC